MSKTYTTGQFAKNVGVSERTIRYYDKMGLLKPSFILENGYRNYVEDDILKIQKIITLKYLGFSLNEIKTMIMEENRDNFMSLLDMQVNLLNQKIQHMTSLKEALSAARKTLYQDRLDWQIIADIVRTNAQDEKIIEYYRNAKNLSIRIRLHEMFSINATGWFPWLYQQIDFRHVNRLLEIGCGNGALWKNCFLDLRNREVFLSDVSQGMIDSARQLLKEDFSYMIIDCQKIPFKGEYFDAVVANHVLFYLNDINKGLNEIHRILRVGGTFYGSTYGKAHMYEICELVKRFDDKLVLSEQSLSAIFGLENGMNQLKPYFRDVQIRYYEDALEINQVQPLFEYIMSCHGNQQERLMNRLDEFKMFLQHIIEEQGSIRITKQAGVFVCVK